jgi:hypothetical protein
MDDFIVYGNTFDEAIQNLIKLLEICQEMNLCLSHEKCHIIITEGVGTGAEPGFNAQERTNKALTIDPFNNTCEADEVSPEVEAGVVARLRCLQP